MIRFLKNLLALYHDQYFDISLLPHRINYICTGCLAWIKLAERKPDSFKRRGRGGFFFLVTSYIFKSFVKVKDFFCEGERWPNWGANKRDTDVLWDQTSHWGAYQREPGNTLISKILRKYWVCFYQREPSHTLISNAF